MTARSAVRQDGAKRRPPRRCGAPSTKTARSAVRQDGAERRLFQMLQEPPNRYRSIPTVTGASRESRAASSPNPNVFKKPNSYSIIPTVTKSKKMTKPQNYGQINFKFTFEHQIETGLIFWI